MGYLEMKKEKQIAESSNNRDNVSEIGDGFGMSCCGIFSVKDPLNWGGGGEK